jgi:hypothetical protein
MQVLLKRSEEKKDIECTICQQGFRLYWERTSPAERDTMRSIIQGELIRHHNNRINTIDPHPARPFNLPEWSGDHQFSGAALLGGLSGVHRVATPRRAR